MTIEEKAREEYPYITPSDGYECHDYNEAAEWLKNQKEEIGISWHDDFEIRFRKDMEE